MKFAATALILGCTALAYELAVQSFPFHGLTKDEPPAAAVSTSQTLREFGFSLPKLEVAIRPVTNLPETPERGPDKAEALLMIQRAAFKHGVSPAFIQSIVAAESNFNHAALSPKGAIGFMQLMPETAEELGVDPTVPEQNIDAGTRYLRWLLDRYQPQKTSLKKVIAAYNAGPGNVDRYHGVPPFRETRLYVARVLTFLHRFEASRGPS